MTVEHFGLRRAAQLLHDQAVVEEEDPVGDRGCARLVRDHHGCLAVAVGRVPHELEDLAARLRVEVPGRLVGEEDRRPRDERARDRDALLLAARELRRAGGCGGSRGPSGRAASSSHSLSGFSPAIESGRTTFSSALSIGRRLKNWKTKPMCSRRRSVSFASMSSVISVPAIETVPDVGLSRPARMCMSVDLPEPDGPMTATSSPERTVRSTPRSASTAVSPSP